MRPYFIKPGQITAEIRNAIDKILAPLEKIMLVVHSNVPYLDDTGAEDSVPAPIYIPEKFRLRQRLWVSLHRLITVRLSPLTVRLHRRTRWTRN